MSAPVLPSFGLVHIRKDDAGCGLSDRDISYLQHSGFFLDTCLRQFAVLPQAFDPRSQLESKMEWYTDRAAYSFMLQTATGLNSAITGESNILGQIRRGWLKWCDANDGHHYIGGHLHDKRRLDPIMHSVFGTSAKIRQKHLHGIGGRSYGSLVRKLLNPDPAARILIIGAGELSRSILPYLQNFELGVWNRQSRTLAEAGHARMFLPAETTLAGRWATHIVITAPADELNDQRWFELAGPNIKTLVHLGRRRANTGIWSALSNDIQFCDLDSVFELRNRQSTIRSLRVSYARKACQLQAAKMNFERAELLVPVAAQRA